MIVRARGYGGSQDYQDFDTSEIDEDFATMELAAQKRNRNGLAPILEPDDDYDDFDASAFVERSYH